ncbi:30S ribosomal protein S21, chloroplastic-like [Phoenix dactylifera]|uniref:30S ribosomal protein S21, chloroplastic-like n=1 Tax=Phoenix dactylifera TaxID=42345 RepID=A0A8B7CEA8_PHODC|nr:30S ribosomal protein S21, chloroplastic-like [Phoenix dactylifera]
MPASLCNLLSFLPSLPLPAKKEPSFSPPATTNLPWRRLSRNKESGFLPALHSRTEAAPGCGGVLRSCFPSLAWANVMFAKGGYYNVQLVVGEDEPEEVLLRRFRREVIKAGVVQECKRRRWFENTREEKKRKAREAPKRRFQPKYAPKDEQEAPMKKNEEEEDNWELPEGELPY